MSVASRSAGIFRRGRSPLGYLALVLGVAAAGFVLFVLGALTALAPELVVRLTPIFVVAVVLLSAGFVRTTTVSSRLVRFWLAAIVVTATLWPSYMAVRVGGLPSIDLRKIVFGVSLLLFLYLIAARPIISRVWGQLSAGAKVLAWCVAIYGLLRIATSFSSQAPVASFLAVVWEWVYYYSPFFVALFLMRDEGARELFVKYICWLIIFVAAFAVYERFSGLNPLVRLAPVSAESAELLAALSLSRLRDGAFRAQATFEHPLMLAEFAAVAAAFSLGQVLSGHAKGIRLLGFAAFFASIVAALLSGSRVAFVSLALVVGAVVLATAVRARTTRKVSAAMGTRLFVIISIFVLAAISIPLLETLVQGRTSTEASSSSARVQMLKAGIPAMMESPFFGSGYGEAVFTAGVHGTGGLLTLDNYLLTVGIDSGVPALFVFMAVFLIPAWMAFKRITEKSGPEQTFLISAMASLMGLLAVRMILSIPYNLVFAFVIAAMVVGAIPKQQSAHALPANR